MSDERKERLLEELEGMYYCSQIIHRNEGITKDVLDRVKKAKDQIRQLIQQKFVSMFEVVTKKDIEEAYKKTKQRLQQKPEIDDMEKYIEEKAQELLELIGYQIYGKYLVVHRERAKDFITQIISDARNLQDVPVVRIKPERMDHMDKGALIGKPREVKIKKKGDSKC